MSYTPKMTYNERHSKTTGERIRDEIMTLAVGLFLIWVICGVIKIIFLPFKYLFMSAKDRREQYIARAKAKVKRRAEYHAALENSPGNPLIQYRLRFEISPESYKGDRDNDAFLRWYMDWRDGKVLDSGMCWAPEIYSDEGIMNPLFVKYLKCQAELHRKAGLGRRLRFLRIIRMYYPEFAPKFSRLMEDINSYLDISEEKKLKEVLRNEISKLGIPRSIAERLETMNLSVEQIVTMAGTIREAIEKDYTPDMALCLAENGFHPDSEEAKFIKRVCGNFKSTLLSTKIAAASAKRQISDDQVVNFMLSAKSLVETMGVQAFGVDGHSENGRSFYEQLVDSKLAEYAELNRHGQIEQKLGKAKWED